MKTGVGLRRKPTTAVRKGTLFVVAVPIGDPDDLTVRAVRVLKGVDIIAPEDPRATQALLAHHRMSVPITSYHHEVRDEKTAILLDRLAAGRSVALVCDAGTPGVFDPGAFLVRRALAQGIIVTPVPGASVVTAALSISGANADRFQFLGSVPNSAIGRRRVLHRVAALGGTVVLFERAERLPTTLRMLQRLRGTRMVTLAADLTRPTEYIVRTAIEECLPYSRRLRAGADVTIVIEGEGQAVRNPRRAGRSSKRGARPVIRRSRPVGG